MRGVARVLVGALRPGGRLRPRRESEAGGLKNTIATLTDDGVTLRRGFGTLAKFPWSEVTAIEADGPEQVEGRDSDTSCRPRSLRLRREEGVQEAYLVITTGDGEAIVETDKFDQMKLRAALQPAQAFVRDR